MMFRPHFGICVSCEQGKLLVVKKLLCKKCNHEQKEKTRNDTGIGKMQKQSGLLHREVLRNETCGWQKLSSYLERSEQRVPESNSRVQKSNNKNNSLQTRQPIRRVSEKRRKQEVAYQALRKVYLAVHPQCQANIKGVCLGLADQVHHKIGRIGERLYDDSKFLAVCGPCHHHIENNREEAIRLGFSELRTNK